MRRKIQEVHIPIPLDLYGLNFKCEACSCEFHLDQFGHLGESKEPMIDVDGPGNKRIVECPNWHCEARIRLITIDKDKLLESEVNQ